MNKFEKFLFFYSILAISILFISFGVYEPKPLNLISTILLIPIIFYFWVRLTSPQSVSADKWSTRFVISLMILGALGVGGYYISKQYSSFKIFSDKKVTESEAQIRQLEEKLKVIEATKKESPIQSPSTATESGENLTDLVFGTPIPLRQITGKLSVKTIDVYEKASLTSKKIATIDGAILYIYQIKQDKWYNIVLSESVAGWVSTSQVQEVQ